MSDNLIDLAGNDKFMAFLTKAKVILSRQAYFEPILQFASTIMAGLAQEDDIGWGVRLDIVRQLQAIQVRHCLKSSEFLCRSATSTNVLSILQIEFRVVQLFTANKLGRIFLLRVPKVEHDRQRIIFDLITVTLLQVPERLFLIAIKDMFAS